MFSVHTTPKEFENTTIACHLDWCLRKIRAWEYRIMITVSYKRLKKHRFQNVFRPHYKAKPAFPNFSGLTRVFQKLPFRDGLVWAEGVPGELKLRFQKFLWLSVDKT